MLKCAGQFRTGLKLWGDRMKLVESDIGSGVSNELRRCARGVTFVRQNIYSLFFVPLAFLVFSAAAYAQVFQLEKSEDQSDFVRIPLEATPDVLSVRRGQVQHSYSALSLRSIEKTTTPNQRRFLGGIDLKKVRNIDSLELFGETLNDLQSQFISNIETWTVYDDEGGAATEFNTSYPKLGASLHCYWVYDRQLWEKVQIAEAKSRELELESAARGEAPSKETDSETQRAREDAFRRLSALFPSGDPESPELYITERQFKVGGRPCLLSIACVSRTDGRCSDHVADQLVSATVLIRTGD